MRFPKVFTKKFLSACIALFFTVIVLGLFIYQDRIVHGKEVAHVQRNVLSIKTKNTTPSIVTPVPLTANPTKTLPARTIYLGMWTGGLWDDKSLTFHPEALNAVQNKIGKKVAIAHIYTGWSNLVNPAFISQLQIVSNNGWRPMVSVNPYFFASCPANGKTLYKAISDGNCDDFLRSVGVSLKQYNNPIYLRFAWEMNITNMDWSVQKTGDSPTDYIAAWRHFHEIVATQGANNVQWVFAPNTMSSSSIPYNQLYPGDAYVDWLGLDGYNWGSTQSWSSWQNFSQVFSTSYKALTQVAPAKPLMVTEVNTTDTGGDKAAWYKDMLTVQIPYNFPKISAIVFYNEDRTTQENVNWLIDTAPATLAAFIQGISLPLYISSF